MVWLHGGGFATGTPTRAREEPSLLCARGDVVVARNPRLGAFGYLYLDEDGPPSVTLNLGMLDIIVALEWLQENIEAFGGDPGNVTVFGESGGAMKTATLLAIVPDRVAPEKRALASWAFGFGGPVGVLIGVNIAAAASPRLSYALLAALLAESTTLSLEPKDWRPQ
jgi:carboxylesterase type B